MNKQQQAAELRKAIQLFLSRLDPEMDGDDILSVASAFPGWKVGWDYRAGEILRYGENGVGDAQLYQVLQDHTSAEEWAPDAAASLYKAIGVTEEGYPEWIQPLGASDAYNTGDQVMHNQVLWESDVDGNVWEPGVYGWTKIERSAEE